MIGLLLLLIALAIFWDEICILYGIIIMIAMVLSLRTFLVDGTRKKMKFISDAQKDGRYVPAKLTCLTREGKYDKSYYMAEYMYVVNGKRYFTTYKITSSNVTDISKDKINGDILALNIEKYPTFFYDESNPAKVYCKADIFTSCETFRQINSSKQNLYRDVNKDWIQAIDLVTY